MRSSIILMFLALLISGCAYDVENMPVDEAITVETVEVEQTTINENASEITEPVGSELVLQTGFSDEHILQAEVEGFTLQDMRESMLGDDNYIIYFLERDSDPRILNKPASVILVYKQASEQTDIFLHRIDVNDSINLDSISNNNDWSSSLPFHSDVMVSYNAAGFDVIGVRTSKGEQGNTYYGAILKLSNVFHMNAFEQIESQADAQFLDSFTLPQEYMPEDFSDLIQILESSEWHSDIIPNSRMEKSLFAIGCQFDPYMPLINSAIIRGQELSQASQTYWLYSCSLVLLPDWGYSYEESSVDGINIVPTPINFIAIYGGDQDDPELLWNSFYGGYDIDPSPGDINSDEILDVSFSLVHFARNSAAGNAFSEGSRVLQFARDGYIIDLIGEVGLIGGGLARGNAGIAFEDINEDGVLELVIHIVVVAPYEPAASWGSVTAISDLYVLEDDFYYVPVRDSLVRDNFDFLCLKAIDRLGPDVNDFAFRDANNYDAQEIIASATMREHDGLDVIAMYWHYDAISSVVTECNTVGIAEENRGDFILKLVSKFPGGCGGFLETLKANNVKPEVNKYWADIIDTFSNECREFGRVP